MTEEGGSPGQGVVELGASSGSFVLLSGCDWETLQMALKREQKRMANIDPTPVKEILKESNLG